MRKRIWIIGGGAVAALGVAMITFVSLHDPAAGAHRQKPLPPPDIQPLADQRDVIGEWNRVEFPDAVIPVNWRRFSATGEFRVRYGDVIHWGTYRFIDGSNLETREGHDGEVNRWTVGRANGRLVLIHPKNGWVEQYVSVPDGTLQP